MPDYEPLTVEQIIESLPTLKEDADEQRIYDTRLRMRLQQAYDGGEELTDPQNKWILRHDGESREDWRSRRLKLRSGVNPCRLIPDKITAHMTNGTIVIEHTDQELQQRVSDAQERNGWTSLKRREVERLCSIFGTVSVGVYWNKQKQYVDYFWSDVDQLYPVQSSYDANTLDALMIARTSEHFRGKFVKFGELIDIWTPIERDRIAKAPKSDVQLNGYEKRQLRNNKYISLVEDKTNPFGVIPFATFRARPSAKVGCWFALSDIQEAHKTLEFILEQINNLAAVMDKQSFAQLVIIGETETGKVTLGPSTPLVLDNSKQGSSDVKYVVPGAQAQMILDVIEQFYKYSFEVEGVPMVAVRTMEAPESGIALKLKMQPLQEITEERRKRHAQAERQLWILTAMALDIYGERFMSSGEFDRVFTPDEARATFETVSADLTVTHMNDYNQTDESDDLDVIEHMKSLDLITEYEAWLRSGHVGTENDYRDWLESKRQQEIEKANIKEAGTGVFISEEVMDSPSESSIDGGIDSRE